MTELMWFIVNKFILPTILFSPFVWLIFTSIKRVRKEMKEGKTLWQALNNSNGYKGVNMQLNRNDVSSIDYNAGYTSSKLASDPMFSCLPGNINHRR